MDLMNRPVKVRSNRKGGAAARARGRLADVCEPIFLYAMRLNRSAALGNEHGARQVRADFEALFDRAGAAAAEAGLADSFARVRRPLVYYCDFQIASQPAAWARRYAPMAPDAGDFAGDDEFYDIFVKNLLARDPRADPSVRDEAEVLYLCLATGFTGRYDEGSKGFAATLDRLARAAGVPGGNDALPAQNGRAVARVGLPRGYDLSMSGGRDDRLCPDAYAHTDARELAKPVAGRVWTLVLIALLLVAAVLVAGGFVYVRQTQQLQQLLDQIDAPAEVTP